MNTSFDPLRRETGLLCLEMVAKLLDVAVDIEQFRRASGADFQDMHAGAWIRAAKKLELKAALKRPAPEDLPSLPIPSVAIMKDGSFVVLGRCEAGKIAVYDPLPAKSVPTPLADFFAAWGGELILVTRRFRWKDAGKRFSLAWFLPVFARFRRLFLEVVVASFFLQLFGLVSPLFTQVIIDKVLVHRGVSTLDVLAVGLLVTALFEAWLGILRNYIFMHTTNKVDVILGVRLFHHLIALPLRYFELRRVGDTVARIRELETIRQFITGSGLTLLLDSLFGLVFIALMFYYSVPLGLVALLFLPCYALLAAVVNPLYRQQLQEKFEAGAENHSFLVESITGVQTIKSLALEPQFIQRWERYLARYVKVSFQSANLGSVSSALGQLLQRTSNLAILWYGAHLVMDGQLTVGQLIAFQMLFGQVNGPVLRIVNMWQSFQQTRISVDRLGDILNAPAEPVFQPQRTTLPALQGQIVMENVSFRYWPDAPPVLNEISLAIQPGMRVGIVGRSGSGKSTLVKLLQRLYVCNGGRILLDGVDISQVEAAWLRTQIGVVPQESFLFGGTVRDNIAAVRPGASIAEVMHAAKIAGAHEFIKDMPEGYDSHVGERGSSLSGGQKQRVALARALLNNPRMLIFDEATSALDVESEQIIMQNMDLICRGRTVLVIAHRLSTVRGSDLILVLEGGRLVEQGKHQELLSRKGRYHQLFSSQEGLS